MAFLPRTTGALFHEFSHAGDKYSGWDRFLTKIHGPSDAGIILEYNTYERIYNMFGTQREGYEIYKNAYDQLIKKLILK